MVETFLIPARQWRAGINHAHRDWAAYVPEVKLRKQGSYVLIRFVKKGITALRIYIRLRGQDDWQLLDAASRSYYKDERPLAAPGVPELREYRFIAQRKDELTGQYSEVLTATVL